MRHHIPASVRHLEHKLKNAVTNQDFLEVERLKRKMLKNLKATLKWKDKGSACAQVIKLKILEIENS